MVTLLALASAAMPLPPPPQHIVMTPGIARPPGLSPPLANYPRETIPAAAWSCRVESGNSVMRIAGTVQRIEPDPTQIPVPRWPPFTIATVDADPSHHFAGTYLATFTPMRTYGFRLAHDGQTHELTVLLGQPNRTPTIEIKRVENDRWVETGSGICSARASPATSAGTNRP